MPNPNLTRLVFVPPDKGSFPLDHEGVCKELMVDYMKCLKGNKKQNTKCREEIKKYLNCRMENNLMAVESWSKLGLADVDIKNQEKKE